MWWIILDYFRRFAAKMSAVEDEVGDDFLREKHIKFFKRCLNVLPSSYSSLDTTRSIYILIL